MRPGPSDGSTVYLAHGKLLMGLLTTFHCSVGPYESVANLICWPLSCMLMMKGLSVYLCGAGGKAAARPCVLQMPVWYGTLTLAKNSHLCISA